MQLSSFIPLIFSLIPALVAGYECVTSGTEPEVTAAKNCCTGWGGTFCGTTGYQGICVVPDGNLGAYKYCTAYFGNPTPASDCIPGNGSELTSCYPTSTTTSARITITPSAK